MNNDLYTHTIEFRGRRYRYDPDYDCFYPADGGETTVSRWAWIGVTLVLCALAYYVEYIH